MGRDVASLQDGADLDTTTDMGELLVFLRGWYARMELRLIRARVVAGLERARADGVKLGRPRRREAVAERVRELRVAGVPWPDVAARLGVSESTARRSLAGGEE
jgi:DNA invertase Pin-like site-specific DNA recombinase